MPLSRYFTSKKCIKKLNKDYADNVPRVSETHQLITAPYKVLKLNNLIQNARFIEELSKELLCDDMVFYRKNNDLYSFWQSDDLNNVDLNCSVKKFIDLLKTAVRPLISEITGIEFNEKLSVTASLYNFKDNLLCHDDKCEDRCIAFVYYITGTGAKDEGPFQMFNHNKSDGQPCEIVESVPPLANSFLIFEVGDLTYHQVSEVTSPNFKRLSINGWFHSNRKLNLLKYKEPFPDTITQTNSSTHLFTFLDDIISIPYCTPNFIIDAQKAFENDSYILLSRYFVVKFYEECFKELQRSNKWLLRTPPNRRRYQFLCLNELNGQMEVLTNFLRSPSFVTYLRNVTGLSLLPLSQFGNEHSKLTLEVQKWSAGCYTMATDNDCFFERSGLDLYIYFNSEAMIDADSNGGFTTYLATDEGDEDENELLNLQPVDNALILVYRTSKTVRFTKFINHTMKKHYYCISATYFENDS